MGTVISVFANPASPVSEDNNNHIPVDNSKKRKVEHKPEVNEHKKLKLKHNSLTMRHNFLQVANNALQTEHDKLKLKHNTFVEQLKSKVECPVCYEVPKRTPIPVCPNGHIICKTCERGDCPLCREPMQVGARSLLAATIVDTFLHNCDYTLYGCKVIQVKHADIVKHLETCSYRFHSYGWKSLSTIAGIKLRTHWNGFKDLGVKFSPVTNFYDFEKINAGINNCGKVMWPPNAIEFNGTIFFLYVIADVCPTRGSGMWQFIVEWGDRDSNEDYQENYEEYTASIEVFKPGDNSGCTRHFHMQRESGMLDENERLIFLLDNSQMQGLFLDKVFAVSVKIGFVQDCRRYGRE